MNRTIFSGTLSRRHAPIVIVEDNPDDLLALRQLLETADIRRRLVPFNDAQQAIFHFRHIAGAPSVITPCAAFVSLRLSKADGLEVVAAIRNDPAFANVFIVVLCGADPGADSARALAAGANACLKKFPDIRGLRSLLGAD